MKIPDAADFVRNCYWDGTQFRTPTVISEIEVDWLRPLIEAELKNFLLVVATAQQLENETRTA